MSTANDQTPRSAPEGAPRSRREPEKPTGADQGAGSLLAGTFVVIPSHNGAATLVECVSSVLHGGVAAKRVVVADNASTDGSIDSVIRRFPEVCVLRNAENVGFGAACNFGIAEARRRGAAFVLLLNQDAFLEPMTLASMLSLASERPRAAAIGARTVSTVRCASASRVRLLYDGAWMRMMPLWQRIPGVDRMIEIEAARTAGGTPRQVDFVWGHAMLLRIEALDEVGDFDERFFMYYEDIDLCDRLRRTGWQLWCDSRVLVWHAVTDAARSSPSEAWRWRMKQDSARRYLRKNSRALLGNLFWASIATREFAALLLRGRPRAAAHLLWAFACIAMGVDGARSAARRDRS